MAGCLAAWVVWWASPRAAAAQIDCPAAPRQAQPELVVEANAAVGKLARITGGDLSVRTRRTVRDLLERLPDANAVYMEQMLFAAYCTAVRGDRTLTPAQQAERLARYAREVRAALSITRPAARGAAPGRAADGPARTAVPAPGSARPSSGEAGRGPGIGPENEAARARARERARDSLAFLGYVVTDTNAFIALVRAGKADAVRHFLNAGMSPNLRHDGWPPLAIAAARGDTTMVAALLRAGALPARATSGDVHPLDLAAGSGRVAVVRLLLAAGAGVNARDTANATALHWAARPRNETTVRLLLARGADVRARTTNGETALMRLVAHELDYGQKEPPGARAVAELLLRAGVDRAARDEEGHTAADLARAHRYCAVATLLGAACAA